MVNSLTINYLSTELYATEIKYAAKRYIYCDI